MAAAEVFFDTAGFLALWDASDEHHTRAAALQAKLTRQARRFVTTDYVLDETVTLLRIRHSHSAASDFLDTMEHTRRVRVEWTGSERFADVSAFFRKHEDKEWSFTDCLSFVVMREARIREAFTTDHHFKQAGYTPLLRP